MAAIFSDMDFISALNKEIETTTREAIEKAAEEAADKVRGEVRSKVGQIASRVATELDFQRDGRDLIIRVRFENKQ